ncbi:MAG TPA: sensor histidine kinase [Chitinophagaceae bacterium]|jgi:two-component sensor histidine kinase
MIAKKPFFPFCVGVILFLSFSCRQPVDNGKTAAGQQYVRDTTAANAAFNKGRSLAITNFDSAQYFVAKALTLAQAAGFTEGVASIKTEQAWYERRKGNYTQAVSLSLAAIHIYDSLQLVSDKLGAICTLADTYKEMGGEKGTIEYLQKAMDLTQEAVRIADELKSNRELVICLNERGVVVRDYSRHTGKKEWMDTAAAMYTRAIGIVEQTGARKQEDLGKLYNNISQVYIEYYHDYPRALKYLFKAVDFNMANKNQYSLTYNYANICEAYLQLHDYKNAKLYGATMLNTAKTVKAAHRIMSAYAKLGSVSREMKEYDSALYYTDLHAVISDSLNNETKTSQIAEMQTRFETKQKEAEIGALNQSNTLKNRQLWVALIVALILGGLLLVLVWQKKTLQKQKQQIIEQSNRLQWLMKELHHRVKNNLQVVASLLNMQNHQLKNEESKTAIKESRLRVQAMSLIHQRLYQMEDVTSVNFRSYMNDLANMLVKAYGFIPENIDLQVSIEKEYLDVDTAMPLALLANEIITNSFKYAYKEVSRPLLGISLKNSDRQLQLSISDNGPGMTDTNKETGFGKKLIGILTRQLKAKYTVETTGGTTYVFTIPYINEKVA